MSDTAACDGALIASTPELCPDRPNMMFPLLDAAMMELSAGQVSTLRAGSVYTP